MKLNERYAQGERMEQQEEEKVSSEERLIKSVNNAGFFQLLDITFERIDGGIGKVRIVVDERLMHGQMSVHGGVIFTLADTAMSMALMSLLPPGTAFGTVEAKLLSSKLTFVLFTFCPITKNTMTRE